MLIVINKYDQDTRRISKTVRTRTTNVGDLRSIATLILLTQKKMVPLSFSIAFIIQKREQDNTKSFKVVFYIRVKGQEFV